METALVISTLALIPIIALVSNAYRNVKQREFLHRERMLALERGMPAPLEMSAEAGDELTRRRGRPATAVHGIVWTGIGLGLLTALAVASRLMVPGGDLEKVGFMLRLWAFPALMVGIGLLLYAYFTREGRTKGRP